MNKILKGTFFYSYITFSLDVMARGMKEKTQMKIEQSALSHKIKAFIFIITQRTFYFRISLKSYASRIKYFITNILKI